jgi:hypothetical protein
MNPSQTTIRGWMFFIWGKTNNLGINFLMTEDGAKGINRFSF